LFSVPQEPPRRPSELRGDGFTALAV
jgi:hypothetical protein